MFCKVPLFRLIPAIIGLFFFQPAQSQQVEKWDLVRCVDYAMKNNISVRQSDLQIRFSKLDFDQSKLSLYPQANFSSSLGYSAGRNQDPTSFSLITTGYTFNNLTLQSNLEIFNWFSKKNTIAAREQDFKSSQAGAEKARNDVSLNVAIAYLQILLARENVKLAASQVAESRSQLDRTRKQVDAGKLPELNAANLEASLANDSSNLITAQTNASQALLQLKALLNMDAGTAFDIVEPPIEKIPVENLADLQPEAVYALAANSMPQQKQDGFNLAAAKKSAEAAKGAMYPTISIFGSLGSAYNSKAQEVTGITSVNSPIGTVTVSGTPYQVFPVSPFSVYSYGKIGYFNQLNQNFRQSIGLSVSVPILSGGNLRSSWQRAKLNVARVELTKEQNSFTLKQDIYKAYNDATAAVQKYYATQKSVAASQKAFEYATKRYDLGLLSSYDLVTSRNSLLTAQTQMIYARYDYLFKMKLLEFYKGQGIKL
ncbi:MAG: TolC family protein [Chitinophagaceae bacterium]|nr:TolC family protein [Chitinophagaceae bacterium]